MTQACGWDLGVSVHLALLRTVIQGVTVERFCFQARRRLQLSEEKVVRVRGVCGT